MQTKQNLMQEGAPRISTAQIEDQIRRRAYKIYEARGKEAGHEMEDWMQARDEVLGVVKGSHRSHKRAA